MTKAERLLNGSWACDLFKQLHKEQQPSNVGCDGDLFLLDVIRGSPDFWFPCALLDYKTMSDGFKMSHVVLYNFQKKFMPVFLIRANDPTDGQFEISEYTGGVVHPFGCNPGHEVFPERYITTTENWRQYWCWENSLRRNAIRFSKDLLTLG